jgi:RecJ-like exonuclease
MYNCPQCGEETPELHEGYCRECCDQNQAGLDNHNAAYSRWMSMTDVERDRIIRASVSGAGFVVQ